MGPGRRGRGTAGRGERRLGSRYRRLAEELAQAALSAIRAEGPTGVTAAAATADRAGKKHLKPGAASNPVPRIVIELKRTLSPQTERE